MFIFTFYYIKLILTDSSTGEKRMSKKITILLISFIFIISFIFGDSSLVQAKTSSSPKKVVYLTFDDGPSVNTRKILDILNRKKVKGTFFLIEPNIKRYPLTAKRIVREGSYVGLHSVSHSVARLYKGSPTNVATEMEKTRLTLKKVTNVDSHLTRVPYGSKPYMTTSFRNALVKKKLKMWDWNIDSLDWKYSSSNPAKIVSNVKTGLKGKKGPVIILFHEKKGTIQKLPEIIDYLRKNGYTFAIYDPNHHFQMNFWKDKRL